MKTPALLVALALIAAEPASAEPAAPVDPAQAESAPTAAKPDAAKADAAKVDAAKVEPAKPEAAGPADGKGVEPQAAAGAAPAEPPKADAAKVEPAKADAAATPGAIPAPAATGAAVAAPTEPVPPPPPPPAPQESSPQGAPAAEAPAAGTPAAALLAAESAPPAPPEPEKAGKDYPNWGLTIDAGAPDTGGVGLLYRPWHWLRFEASATTTVWGPYGYRAGVSLVPFLFPITPTLTLNYGRVLEGDWNKVAKKAGATIDPELQPVLEKFGYQYVDAHVGIELGAPRRFVFFVRAGISQFWTTVHNLTPAAASKITDSSTTVTMSDMKLTVRGLPSAKVGFLLYLF